MLTTDVNDIKKELLSMMNGPLSQSLREKGVGHRVIFGVELPRLQSFSEEIEHSYTLALALWHENIRECRLLATMVMPHNALTADEADTWAEEIKYAEEANCYVYYLVSHLPFASEKVFQWTAHGGDMQQLCGLLLAGRLLADGRQFTARDETELLDQATALLSSERFEVKKAAYNLLLRMADTSLQCARQVDNILKLHQL